MTRYIIVHKTYLHTFARAITNDKAKFAKKEFLKDGQFRDWKHAKKAGWLCKRVNIIYL